MFYDHSLKKNRKEMLAAVKSTLSEMGLVHAELPRLRDLRASKSFVRPVVGAHDAKTGLELAVFVPMTASEVKQDSLGLHVALMAPSGSTGSAEIVIGDLKAALKKLVFWRPAGGKALLVPWPSLDALNLQGFGTIDGFVMDLADTVKKEWDRAFDIKRCRQCGGPIVKSNAGREYCADICWENKAIRDAGLHRLHIKKSKYGTDVGDHEPEVPVEMLRDEYIAIAGEAQAEFGITRPQFSEICRGHLGLGALHPSDWLRVADAVISKLRQDEYDRLAAAEALKPPSQVDVDAVIGDLFAE